MKKLFVLALLGLGLGGGVWKAQNPDGTVDTFRAQAEAQLTRLKTGAEAVLAASPDALQQQNATAQEQQALATEQSGMIDALTERLALLETTLEADAADSNEAAAEPLTAEIASELGNTQAQLARTSEQQASLEQSVASVQTSLTDIQTSVKDAAAGNEAGIIRLDAIDSRLELLVRRLDEQGYDESISSLNDTLSTLQTDIQSLEQSLEQRQSDMNNGLADVNEKVSALSLRLDTLAATATVAAASATDSGAADAAEDSDGTAAASQALASLSSGIDERFNALESRVQTVNSDSRKLTEVNEQLAALQSSIAELNEKSQSNSRALETLGSSVDGLKTAGESLSIDTVQAEIRDQLALVQSQFESDVASENADALESLLDATRTRIRTLEQRVQDLPASSSEADNAQQIQTALESQIVALERRLESINSADPELASTLSTVQEKVDQLAAKEFVTQEDLRAQNETRSVEYKIYFDRNSAEITDGAAKVLESFIAQEKNRTTGVSIFGFTDRRGSAAYNQQLALQRATNVRSYLIQNGLDYTKIKALTGLGEDAAAAVLPDNADDAQQRVVVLYAAQP